MPRTGMVLESDNFSPVLCTALLALMLTNPEKQFFSNTGLRT
jgi:hypothetical protein